MIDHVNGATTPLDCTTPLDVLMELYSRGSDEAYIERDAFRAAPDWDSERFAFPELSRQIAHGPLAPHMPERLYAFTSVARAEKLPELTQTTTVDGTFIVGPRMKAVIDAFAIPKTEMLPLAIVLRDKPTRYGQNEHMGGGAVVEGSHWLWHVMNRYELVDWENSEQEPHWTERPRGDLPGAPVQRFSGVSNTKRLVLYPPPYDESAVFQILGSSYVFGSPAFAYALRDAGLLWGDSSNTASAVFKPWHLDEPRRLACSLARRHKQIDQEPPLRVFGTDILAGKNYHPPFKADLPSWEKN